MLTQTTTEPTKTNVGTATKPQAPSFVITPPMDVLESADGLEVLVDLPGVTAEGLTLDLDDGVLTLTARRDSKLRDRSVIYKRRLVLPREISHEKLQAKLQDGVLILGLPKRAENKPRRIQVSTG